MVGSSQQGSPALGPRGATGPTGPTAPNEAPERLRVEYVAKQAIRCAAWLDGHRCSSCYDSVAFRCTAWNAHLESMLVNARCLYELCHVDLDKRPGDIKLDLLAGKAQLPSLVDKLDQSVGGSASHGGLPTKVFWETANKHLGHLSKGQAKPTFDIAAVHSAVNEWWNRASQDAKFS